MSNIDAKTDFESDDDECQKGAPSPTLLAKGGGDLTDPAEEKASFDLAMGVEIRPSACRAIHDVKEVERPKVVFEASLSRSFSSMGPGIETNKEDQQACTECIHSLPPRIQVSTCQDVSEEAFTRWGKERRCKQSQARNSTPISYPR